MRKKNTQLTCAPAVVMQREVRCAMTDKDGTCREPATVEIYAIPNQMWYPLCEKHRVNMLAPTRKISQPDGASNAALSEAADRAR
jgi:hypothetical protein